MSAVDAQTPCPCGARTMHHDDEGDPERHSAFLRPWPDAKPPEGVMLAAVNRDLATIKVSEVPGGFTYAAIAVYLAGVIDKRGADDGPSVTAKLADQLGKAMQALTRKGGSDDDGFQGWEDSISEPVRE
jgi:hypothetical protein